MVLDFSILRRALALGGSRAHTPGHYRLPTVESIFSWRARQIQSSLYDDMLHTASMQDRLLNVVLVGFRNDIAKARTLQVLRAQGKVFPGELPWLLYGDVDHVAGAKIKAELEELGAQVVLDEVGVHLDAERLNPRRVEAATRTTDPVFGRAVAWIAVAAVAAAGFSYLSISAKSKRATRAAPPQRVAAPIPDVSASRPVELDHRSSQDVLRLNSEAVRLAEQKDYAAAAERLRHALKLAPTEKQVRDNLQMVLLSWAGAEWKDERADLATEHLQEADALGDNGDVVLSLAVAAQRSNHDDLAIATLERGQKVAPTNPTMMIMLAEYRLQQRDRAAALALLQQARDAGLHDPTLNQRIAALSREVDAEWDFVERDSAHFAISFAGTEDLSSVRLVLDTLEDAYHVVGGKFRTYPDDKTDVVLYPQENFHRVTQTPDWAGAAFDGRIKLPVGGLTTADDDKLARVLRHEYAHRIVATLSGNHAPVWLQEGLAVWSEEDREGDHEAGLLESVGNQAAPSLTLLAGPFTQLPAASAQTAYAFSYLAVRALVDRFGSASIPEFLRSLQTNSIDAAFDSVFREKFVDFDERFQRDHAA